LFWKINILTVVAASVIRFENVIQLASVVCVVTIVIGGLCGVVKLVILWLESI